MTRVSIDEALDPDAARVLLTRDAAGRPVAAQFDMEALPRVEPLLLGKPAAEVPHLVERLCGICPQAHHLAGVRALEALAGVTPPPAAELVRGILHHAAVLATHALTWLPARPEPAVKLVRFAKLVMAAAGSPGHFPATAIVGGVSAAVADGDRERCLEALPNILETALAIAADGDDGPGSPCALADVGLVDGNGNPALYGSRLRAVAPDGAVLAEGGPAEFEALIAEEFPGAPAPRPFLAELGSRQGGYRVGPAAQLRLGTLQTPQAATAQAAWLAGPQPAGQARAIVCVHAVERIAADFTVLGETPPAQPAAVHPVSPGQLAGRTGTGWVDSARGLLAHRYQTDAQGNVVAATILTPTAQNEPWLAQMLLRAAGGANPEAAMAAAIRAADPCLPCASAPPGKMAVRIEG
ncbi:MAG: nickel-dependent hydrogenase large subunit [Propionibacteriaceae bacterium]|jgi:NAD-reducing hydrogenase large subunit|nr:nickel-dependent hydrogenase large subunit [Propionibacteriaceae bacterium]